METKEDLVCVFTPEFFDDAQMKWRENKVKIMSNGKRRWSGSFRYGCIHHKKTKYCKRKLNTHKVLCDFHYNQRRFLGLPTFKDDDEERLDQQQPKYHQ